MKEKKLGCWFKVVSLSLPLQSEVFLTGTSVEITRHVVLEGLNAPWLKLKELS